MSFDMESFIRERDKRMLPHILFDDHTRREREIARRTIVADPPAPRMPIMTDEQRARLREILTSLQQAGISFAYQPHRQEPEMTVEMAMGEILGMMGGGSVG